MGVDKLLWVFCGPRSQTDGMRWGFLPDDAKEVREEKVELALEVCLPSWFPIQQIHKEVVMLLRHNTEQPCCGAVTGGRSSTRRRLVFR